MSFLKNIWNDFLVWVKTKAKQIEVEEPKQIESPGKKKPSEDIRVKKFQEAFEMVKEWASQGIEEDKHQQKIKDWWAEVGKKGYTHKTPWCTLCISIPLMRVGLLTKEMLPKNVALARGYINEVPKGFKFVKVADLAPGDIAVKWRGTASSGGGPNGWQGHIGWFAGYTDDKKGYYSYGCNQSDEINKKIYKTSKLLGGLRVIGDALDSVEEESGVDMSIDSSYISERFRQRALDNAKKYLLAKEVRNSDSIAWAVKNIKKNQSKYIEMEKEFKMPWQLIAAIHFLESSLRFTRHLHNGDPLDARTVRVPAGRPLHAPKNGREYSFMESAKDALTVKKRVPSKWTLPHVVHYLESYNGFGYYFRGLNSSYLMSGTQFQPKGKYVTDGVFDTSKSSKRAGAIILMKKLGYEPL